MSNILVFTADWCRPCNLLKTNLACVEFDLANQIKNYDIDEDREVAIQYNIEAIPTIITLDASGNEVSRTLGVKSAEELEQLIRNV